MRGQNLEIPAIVSWLKFEHQGAGFELRTTRQALGSSTARQRLPLFINQMVAGLLCTANAQILSASQDLFRRVAVIRNELTCACLGKDWRWVSDPERNGHHSRHCRRKGVRQ